MPRKTRKEKIIADLRRKVQKLSVDTGDYTITYKPKEKAVAHVSATVRQTAKPVMKTNTAKLTTNALVIRRDLRKTFIISTLAIVAELVLYLATK